MGLRLRRLSQGHVDAHKGGQVVPVEPEQREGHPVVDTPQQRAARTATELFLGQPPGGREWPGMSVRGGRPLLLQGCASKYQPAADFGDGRFQPWELGRLQNFALGLHNITDKPPKKPGGALGPK